MINKQNLFDQYVDYLMVSISQVSATRSDWVVKNSYEA